MCGARSRQPVRGRFPRGGPSCSWLQPHPAAALPHPCHIADGRSSIGAQRQLHHHRDSHQPGRSSRPPASWVPRTAGQAARPLHQPRTPFPRRYGENGDRIRRPWRGGSLFLLPQRPELTGRGGKIHAAAGGLPRPPAFRLRTDLLGGMGCSGWSSESPHTPASMPEPLHSPRQCSCITLGMDSLVAGPLPPPLTRPFPAWTPLRRSWRLLTDRYRRPRLSPRPARPAQRAGPHPLRSRPEVGGGGPSASAANPQNTTLPGSLFLAVLERDIASHPSVSSP